MNEGYLNDRFAYEEEQAWKDKMERWGPAAIEETYWSWIHLYWDDYVKEFGPTNTYQEKVLEFD